MIKGIGEQDTISEMKQKAIGKKLAFELGELTYDIHRWLDHNFSDSATIIIDENGARVMESRIFYQHKLPDENASPRYTVLPIDQFKDEPETPLLDSVKSNFPLEYQIINANMGTNPRGLVYIGAYMVEKDKFNQITPFLYSNYNEDGSFDYFLDAEPGNKIQQEEE